MMRRLPTTGNHAQFRKTSSLAGGRSCPTCRPCSQSGTSSCSSSHSGRTLLLLSPFPSRYLVGQRVFGKLRSFRICFPRTEVYFHQWCSSSEADRTPMVCSGSCIIPLHFSCGTDSKVYSWSFQLTPVSVPLLGADFLQHFNLLVNIKGRRVVHADCPESVIPRASPGPVPAFCSVAFLSNPQGVQKILKDFLDVLSSDGFTASKPCHGV